VAADPYEHIAPFYDAINEEPTERIALVLNLLESYAPTATSVLELGCGTGAVLAGLGSGWELQGVDASAAMLEVARRRLPSAHFSLDDITTVDLQRTFDVVLCVCDTINHVTSLEGWRAVVERAAAHLEVGGLFIMDYNTRGRFLDLDESTPWAHEVDDHTLVMSLDFADPLATWHVRLFERVDRDYFRHHETDIVELSVPTSEVLAIVAAAFDIVETTDTEGGVANDVSHRGVLIARRR